LAKAEDALSSRSVLLLSKTITPSLKQHIESVTCIWETLVKQKTIEQVSGDDLSTSDLDKMSSAYFTEEEERLQI
jgi:hypothetical protein